MAKVTTVEQAMEIAADQTLLASCAKTFSVGGLLVDDAGNVLHAMPNQVIKDGYTSDPTAHGERQLIDWYYSNRLGLPPPSQVTVVTSLDPCCMCTGAILTAGFKVLTAAYDTYSGINYDKTSNFPSLTIGMATRAKERFGYPEVVDGVCYNRPAKGPENNVPAFTAKTIEGRTVALCESIFEATLMAVRNQINNDLPFDQLGDIDSLPSSDPIRVALSRKYPQALQYRSRAPFTPDEGLAPYLKAMMQHDIALGGRGQAVALLDHHGNLLLCMSGSEATSSIRTALMEVTRTYAGLRRQLQLDGNKDTRKYLPHPKYCTFVFGLGPMLDDSHPVRHDIGPDSQTQSFMELGAYGSTMEGALDAVNPSPYQYVRPRMNAATLAAFCKKLPPLYSGEIKVNPIQVANEALIEAIGGSA
ncbi:nucleoside deaminase [Caballeronia mineralivorans]|jgi:tRNA(Arg) A34 adenosine deaminase TadA|uniref:nucleoside deaminase n=1 Tax=Caballeronia mineralivorans TaxID=2010198 RepID=UPI0023F4F368|nr:nucleoside deaminase [Caballeronia mineralivorans]